MSGIEVPRVRRRTLVAIAVIVTVTLGLTSRKFPNLFPTLFGKYPGDALWGQMVYWILCWCFPSASVARVALSAFAISVLDELSQLYRADWIIRIRSTTLGHLVLGSSFSSYDLGAYAIGIAIVALIDFALLCPLTSTTAGVRENSVTG
jgi:hypothetical protein